MVPCAKIYTEESFRFSFQIAESFFSEFRPHCLVQAFGSQKGKVTFHLGIHSCLVLLGELMVLVALSDTVLPLVGGRVGDMKTDHQCKMKDCVEFWDRGCLDARGRLVCVNLNQFQESCTLQWGKMVILMMVLAFEALGCWTTWKVPLQHHQGSL